MTEPNLEKKKDEEIEHLRNQLLVVQDLQSLQNEAYFRQQVLSLLERVAIAEESQSDALQILSAEETSPPTENAK